VIRVAFCRWSMTTAPSLPAPVTASGEPSIPTKCSGCTYIRQVWREQCRDH